MVPCFIRDQHFLLHLGFMLATQIVQHLPIPIPIPHDAQWRVSKNGPVSS